MFSCANVQTHTMHFVLNFFLLSCLPQTLMLECFKFSPIAVSLYNDE